MKKIFLLTFGLLLLLPFGTFAATYTINGEGEDAKESVYLKNSAGEKGELIRASTNVVLNIDSDTYAYAVTSGHLQGQVQYGSTSEFNSMFQGKKTKGDAPDAPDDNKKLPTNIFEEFPEADVGGA